MKIGDRVRLANGQERVITHILYAECPHYGIWGSDGICQIISCEYREGCQCCHEPYEGECQ